MLIKNIESKIKLAFIVSIGSFVMAIIICGVSLAFASRMIARERSQIYVLDNNVPLIATKTNMEDNREAEYKASVAAFHDFFFSMPPDDEYIKRQMDKAMYLIDASGIAQYNTLKEKGYYTNLVSTSSVVTCTMDSIRLDLNTKKWMFYGKQKIERPSMITIRSLVTEGGLQDIPRTTNNSHGVLITNWKTIENKDLINETKKLF
ncbi:conjugative transposon protein TraK [Niabella hirudinis]|uniref:conjugative transposon protein TraK n=1 Tax=Niabella hirudinis TaxID=1285929 RepID=UPI003EB8F0DD